MEETSQQLVMSYYQNPVNNYVMQDFSINISEGNPVCGDNITVFIKIVDEIIMERSFSGQTSMITTASASFFSEIVTQKNIKDVLKRDKYIFVKNGFNVSHRRQRAMVMPLVATINGIYLYLNQSQKLTLDEFV